MADQVQSFYDELAGSYHLIFEDWEASIRRQAAALDGILQRVCGPPSQVRVLDCACGIGTQAIGLASLGYNVTASDMSAASVERLCKESRDRGLNIPMCVADMRDLKSLPDGTFDVVICMDNALPHLENDAELLSAANQISKKLRPGGIFLASIRDYDTLIQQKPTVQGPAFYTDDGKRRIVHQAWDWIDERRYVFHLYITMEQAEGWRTQHHASKYRALLRKQLDGILQSAGFKETRWIFPSDSGFYQPIVLTRTKPAL